MIFIRYCHCWIFIKWTSTMFRNYIKIKNVIKLDKRRFWWKKWQRLHCIPNPNDKRIKIYILQWNTINWLFLYSSTFFNSVFSMVGFYLFIYFRITIPLSLCFTKEANVFSEDMWSVCSHLHWQYHKWEMDRLSGGVDCMFTSDKLPEGNASVILSAAFFSFISPI